MEGWKEVLLDKIAWFRGSGVNKLLSTNEDMVSLINYMDVYKNWQIKQRKDYQKVTAKIREIKEANLLEGDILFTPSSEKPIDIGHAGVVMENMPNCVYSYHLIRGRLYQKDMFDKLFLSYLLNTYKVQKHFVTRASGSGIRYTLSLRDFKSLKITYPVSVSEQTAIAKILSTVDESIRSTRETISKLERVKKSLMQNLLSGKMKPDGTLRPAAEFYEDEKMGLVPKGWKSVKLKEVGNIQTGKTPPTAQSNVFANSLSKGFMFITPGDLGDGKYITDSERYVTEKGIGYSYRLPKGSIAIVCIGSTIGKIGIVSTESCTNQQINAIIVNDMNNNEFLYYLMQYKTPHFKEIAGVNATPQINKSTFQKYRIILPIDKQEQCAIANKLSTIDSEINKKQEKITALESLKKSLMQQLLTGKVRVKCWFIGKGKVDFNKNKK
ncbi:MAG: restriction endonuclease subunit S [Bacteroidales bacterium]|nr:restriction endonuclease subunit S [Bacteroidales bacterium]